MWGEITNPSPNSNGVAEYIAQSGEFYLQEN